MEFLRLAATLDAFGVDYVLVGGAAGAMHGAERPTQDIDCVIRRGVDNLDRVASALRALNARLRVAGMSDEEARALPVQLDVRTLEQLGNSTWTTDAGQFDILADLKDAGGASVPYEVLVTRCSEVVSGGLHVQVASLADVIAAKTFANRDKDREALPELTELASGPSRRPPASTFGPWDAAGVSADAPDVGPDL